MGSVPHDKMNRLLRAAALLRPRALADRARFHARLLERHERLLQHVETLSFEVRSLASKLDTVILRVFLNSGGAHGAHIPASAQPPDLERYTYQFTVGPERQSMNAIRSTLTAEQQPLWTGKVSSY